YTFDNFQNRQIRVIWANPIAASVTPDTVNQFPYGSIIVMETYGVMEDSNGEPVLDANGRYMQAAGAVPTVFVMRKEKGFGVDYGLIRNGEWEYVAYRPDGSYSTPPSGTGSCAACHLTGASGTAAAPSGVPVSAYSINIGSQWDYVFRPELFATPAFGGGSGAVPTGGLQHYVFVPSTIHAAPGKAANTKNSHQPRPQLVADKKSLEKGVMNGGGIFPLGGGRAGSTIPYPAPLPAREKGRLGAATKKKNRHWKGAAFGS